MTGFLLLQRAIGNQAVQRGAPLPDRHARALARNSGSDGRFLIGAAGDRYEREADRIAARVMSAPRGHAGGESAAGREGSAIGASPGSALTREDREFFEARFGRSFAGVRIHAGGAAGASARRLGARAYTVGEDITFASGEYRPGTRHGRGLLAHELVHVVQQRPGLGYVGRGTLAESISGAPSRALQPKLVATGDAAGFADLANAVIAVQFQVVVGSGGEISLRSTNVQGPPTPEAQVLVETLRRVIGDSGTTSIEFIHGATSTRASDARVLGGSFPQSKIDLDDEAVLGTQEAIGLGQGATAGALLAHEIEEQYRKQQLGEGFDEAHAAASVVETEAVGATRSVTTRSITGGTEFTYTYHYPGGRVVVLKFDVINGNRTNIRRTVTP